jgi:hypothetical protein
VWSLFGGFRRLRVDDFAFAREILAGDVLRISRQRGFPNFIAGWAARVIRVDRWVRMHGWPSLLVA